LIPLEEDVLEFIARVIAGEEAVKIIRVLGEKEMSDEEIAKKANLKEDVARRALYRLYQGLLVRVRRERDEETGRYKFFWSLNLDQVEAIVRDWKRKILRKLEAVLEHEENNKFFFCGTPGCRRYTFDEAYEYLFRCPRCGRPLEYYDNSKEIEALRAKIAQIKSELGLLGRASS